MYWYCWHNTAAAATTTTITNYYYYYYLDDDLDDYLDDLIWFDGEYNICNNIVIDVKNNNYFIIIIKVIRVKNKTFLI